MRERSSIGCASKPTCTAPPPSVIPHAPSGRAAPPILSRCRVPPARASTSNEQHASAASQHVAPTSTTPAPPPSQLQQGPPAPSGSTPSHLAAPPPAHAQLAAAAAAVQGAVPDDDDLVTVYETEEVDEDVTVPAPPARSHTAAAPAQQSSRPSSTATATAASHQSQQRTHGQHPSTSAKPGVAAVGAAAAPPPPLAASSLTSTHSMQQTVGGWVVAAALLLAARLGREESDKERQDLRALQVRQAESRVQSAELRAKRRAFLEQERARKEQEAARRLEEARRRSEAEAAAKAAREAAYREEAAKETARLWAEQQAAREEFLAAEARLAAELEKRTAVERALREQELARRREEEERARQEYEKELRRREAEAAARAEERRRQEEAREGERREARRQRRAAQTRFCVTLEGSAVVQQAPLGTATTQSLQPGWRRGPQLARLTLQLSARYLDSCCFLPASAQLPPDSPPTVAAAAAAAAPRPAGVSAVGARFGLGGGEEPSVEVGTRAAWRPAAEAAAAAGRQEAAFASALDALDAAPELTAAVAAPLLQGLWPALAAAPPQAPGEGLRPHATPAELMGQLELVHWQRVGAALLEVASRTVIGQVAPLADRQPLEQQFQVRLLRAALPPAHAASLGARMERATQALAEGELDDVVQVLGEALEDERDALSLTARLGAAAWPPAPPAATVAPVALPPLTLRCLLYALLHDHVAAAFPLSSSPNPHAGASPSPPTPSEALAAGLFDEPGAEASAKPSAPSPSHAGPPDPSQLGQQVLQLARYQLRQAAKRVEADALTPSLGCVHAALGPAHPLTRHMAELAELNLSPASRLKAESRKQQAELEEAAALLRAQDPSASMQSLDPNDSGSRQALVPVPERLWAVRNTASNLVRFGEPMQTSEAIASLQGACDLAASHYGATHPSCLGVLLDTRDALLVALARAAPGSEQAGRFQAALDDVTQSAIGVVKAVAERFMAAQDALSVAVLYEAAVKELGQGAAKGALPESLAALQRQASQLLFQLTPAEARVAMSKRNASASLLRALAREFTEELGVYASTSRRAGRLEQWRTGAPLAPLR